MQCYRCQRRNHIANRCRFQVDLKGYILADRHVFTKQKVRKSQNTECLYSVDMLDVVERPEVVMAGADVVRRPEVVMASADVVERPGVEMASADVVRCPQHLHSL